MASKKSPAKKSAKKKTSHYPVVLGTDLQTVGSTSTTKILRVDRELSKLNHRLYRMCRYYNLKIDLEPSDSADSRVSVYVLRDDWVLQKAVQMAYSQYLENTKEERAKLSKTNLARWQDFRVDDGLSVGFDELVSRMYTTALGATNFTAGEFELSKVVDSTGATRTFTMGAGTVANFSVLSEYDAAGNQQATPDSLVTGGYNALDDESDVANVTALQDDGNLPPYNQDDLADQQPWVRIAVLGNGAEGQQRLSTGNIIAPMGLVVFQGVNTANALSFSVKRGDYKGIHAPSMLE